MEKNGYISKDHAIEVIVSSLLTVGFLWSLDQKDRAETKLDRAVATNAALETQVSGFRNVVPVVLTDRARQEERVEAIETRGHEVFGTAVGGPIRIITTTPHPTPTSTPQPEV